MENSWEEKKKPFNIFQRFLMVAVIPTIFAIIVLVLLLMYSGADVAEKGKELLNAIPFLSEEKKSTDKLLENNKNTISSLQTKLKERDKEIKSLESQLENSENRFQSANSEKEKLQSELQSLQSAQEETKKAMNEIVKTYETMSPKNAAAILSEMSEKEAMKILGELKPAKLASVLEKMEPAVASKYTELLSKSAKASQ
ncbi:MULTISPECIES: MotE family protein [Niallia]|jgi:flagellar motility protein MotE (MotC chaperone)|uniref:MotE family protein n=1 Tax=Niallia TaxID=2837506 RepID=UPI000F45829A|nr:hypothetical protein [Niallia circulans]AYV71168.1 hypothetical protein C2H98_06020 [Niallia circulans]NRG29148.1 hypothetical protein [Niallia circulans]